MWDVRERVIWVVGLARSGCAAGYLLRDEGAHVIGIDDGTDEAVRRRWEREGLTNLAPRAFDDILTGGGWPSTLPDAVVISPGVPPSHPSLTALPATVPVLGETEVGARFCRADLAAITGTNGKSTTTAWLAHVVAAAGRRAEAVGNLGRPLSEVARDLEPGDVAVVEVSSFQLETVDTFRPRVGVVLNLAPDHLDRYPDLATYYGAKRVLADKVDPAGAFVTWTGCREALAWPTPARRVVFGDPAQGATVCYRDDVLVAGTNPILPVADLALASPPNLVNALAVTTAALALDVGEDALAAGLRDFPGLAHRHQVVARRGGVAFINDSKATNVHAVCSGLDGYRGEVVLLVGGSGKGEDYRPLREVMGAVRHVVTIGVEGPAIGAALADIVPTTAADGFETAVCLAADLAAPDAAVLLSPACASFDMFGNYRERGEAFTAAAAACGAELVAFSGGAG